MSKWTKPRFELSSGTKVDLVAHLDGRIRVKEMELSEAQRIMRKPSKWRMSVFQVGFHSYKSTE